MNSFQRLRRSAAGGHILNENASTGVSGAGTILSALIGINSLLLSVVCLCASGVCAASHMKPTVMQLVVKFKIDQNILSKT